ncbi:VWA domain-containing protein [Paenibacillus alkaliterrae]|uniref:vWA domain-containing protein n=1 Tax=Paenibacillus alkaliterrae TaxID=320909 RepID=UPI001F2E7519|nr:vWA domain-containing protein [Paenibacillus alkaliterrae]MCF2939644.1 VWA domain-containing protein [Paenibacillus alkaliterrae]
MKAGHSFKGSGKQRRSFSWITAIMLTLTLSLSACSSAGNNASDSGNRETAGNRGNETSDAAKEEITNSSDDKAMSNSEPVKEKEGGKRGYPNPEQEVQAGQLTAGEWDDIAAWERFGNVLNTEEGDSSKRAWGFWNFHRLEVVVTANGKAVSDAKVTLLSGKETAWKARTNTEGRAYVYAGLFEDTANQGTYKVQVQSAQESKTTQQLEIPQQGSVKVDLGNGAALSQQVDVMFVVDTTGSMEDELNYLEAELKDVVKRISDQQANQLGIRISANFYRDKHDDYIVKPYPFTTDINKVIDQFSMQKAQGGGDYPEAVDQALRDAIHEHKWSEEARARLLFLVLDAPPHNDPQIIDEIQKLIEDAAEQGIRIIPIASSGVSVDTEYLLRFMAAATGGTYLFLTDDSGIGGDHLKPAVGEYEVKLLNDLLVEVINRYVQ